MAMRERRSARDRANRDERLDEGVIRELASCAGPTPVTSLYLDVDGRHRPTAADVERAARRLYRQARRLSAAIGDQAAAGVESDLAAVAARLGEGIDRAAIRGLAFFSCAASGLFRVLELPVAVRDQVSVGPRPDVLQLAEVLEKSTRYLLVLVDRQECRFVRARLGRLEEHPGPFDPVERQVDHDVEVSTFERRHHEAASRHLRRVAAAVAHEMRANPVDTLVVGGSHEAVDGLMALLSALPAPVVVERTTLAVHAGYAEQARLLDRIDGERQARRQSEMVIDLRDRIGTGRGTGGLEATLEALADGRVATLVVKPGYAAVGARCPACGYLAASARPCPRCGAGTEAVDDIVEAAVEAALAQHASVEVCSDPGLHDLGDVAALERF